MSTNMSSGGKSGLSPTTVLVVSVGAIILWAFAILFEVKASQAQILSQPSNGIVPTLSVLNQWPEFVQGQLSPLQTAAFFYGWGIEIGVLAFAFAYDIVDIVTKSAHPLLSKFFFLTMGVVFILDIVSNGSTLPAATSWWVRAGFAVILAFCVAFLGPLGIRGLEWSLRHAF